MTNFRKILDHLRGRRSGLAGSVSFIDRDAARHTSELAAIRAAHAVDGRLESTRVAALSPLPSPGCQPIVRLRF